MKDESNEGSDAIPLDRTQWEEYFAKWQEAEAQFLRDPADGLRVAERLLMELSGASGNPPKQVVRELAWKREYRSDVRTPVGDGNPLDALYDLARGLADSVRLLNNAQAASRGMNAAREHRRATAEDSQQAMDVYRDACSRLLGIKREQLLASGRGAGTPAAGGAAPNEQPGVTDDPTRERMIAEKLVREAMIPYEQAEARADRRRTARWMMVQLMGSLVVGLIGLASVIWILSLK